MSDQQPAPRRVVNIEEAPFMDWGHGEHYSAQMGRLGPLMGAEKLGFNITKLPPGKCAFPYHFHYNNEELFVILEGTGRARVDGQEYPLRKGDIISCPPGASGAHKIINDSDAEMVYLAVSTNQSPEVVEYPDSGKVGAMAGWSTGQMVLRKIFPADADVDYWDGEDSL